LKKLKNSLTIRGDSLYCPLSFSLDTYGNCLEYCHHCYFRKLNHVWGKELKPLDIMILIKRIENGLKNKNPKTSLAHAIKQKKTLRMGNKTDPYQSADIEYKATRKALRVLQCYDWEIVIQTRFTENMERDEDIFFDMNTTVMPIVSPGLDRDWETFEKKNTTRPIDRLQYLKRISKRVRIGVNGEPFIPGFHTVREFEEVMKLLKKYKIPSYNAYNLHFNDWVAKKFHSIGLDIEKIWYMNQDSQWKKILSKLIDISKKYDIILGCPDFVNSGSYQEKVNTCCGVHVGNPTTFNLINWKKKILSGVPKDEILKNTWDGVGDFEEGKNTFEGKNSKMYSLKDIEKDEGLFI
jgi:DNA repair photolyase